MHRDMSCRGRRAVSLKAFWRRSRASLILLPCLLVIALGAGLLNGVRTSEATPNWARKYDADCALCHYPVAPRLNSFGQRFRWAGYRTPAEFNTDQDLSKVGDFLAARLTSRAGYQNNRGQVERTELTLSDATLFYAGPISKHFSGLFRPSIASDGELSITGQLQAIYGDEHRFFSVRGGQMASLLFVGLGGLDRPTGISLPPIYLTRLTNGGAPFSFVQAQKGIELSYVIGRGRLLGQVLNGLDENGSGTNRRFDIDPDKDYVLAYQHILDDIASSFTVFYYHGTLHGTPAFPTVLAPGGFAPLRYGPRFDFSRLGINLNKVFPLTESFYIELLGGYVRSHDNVPVEARQDRAGNAYYVESQQVFLGSEFALYERVSFIDQDVGRQNSMRKVYTAGAALRLSSSGRLAAEYTYTDNRDREVNGASGHVALLELFIAW